MNREVGYVNELRGLMNRGGMLMNGRDIEVWFVDE